MSKSRGSSASSAGYHNFAMGSSLTHIRGTKRHPQADKAQPDDGTQDLAKQAGIDPVALVR